MVQQKTRGAVGYVHGRAGRFDPSGASPFYAIDLDGKAIDELLALLEDPSSERAWRTMTVTPDNANRLKLTLGRTPDFERAAPRDYVRGETLRVSGRASLNVDFSSPVGAQLLAERLRSARKRMDAFVRFVVPKRSRHIVAFVPDTELAAEGGEELAKLGQTGAALAAKSWPADDFSDWES